MNRACPTAITCPGSDFPIANYSSEYYDGPIFGGLPYPVFNPNDPLSDPWWSRDSCLGVPCISYVSQEEADACAARIAYLCSKSGTKTTNPTTETDPKVTTVCNEFQSYTIACPAGYAGGGYGWIGAGVLCSTTQTLANRLALDLAKNLAYRYRLCFGPLSHTQGCLGTAFTATLRALGTFGGVTLTLVSGPAGMTLTQITSTQARVTFTPTTSGAISFVVQGTNYYGVTNTCTYTICVLEITSSPAGVDSATLPDATVGSAYSVTLQAPACAVAPVTFSLVSGALPTGLSLNETTGLISGTPTDAAGNYSMTFVASSGTGNSAVLCTADFELTLLGGALLAYFKCDEASPITQLNNSVGAFHMPLSVGIDGVSVAGKISTALEIGVANRIFTTATDAHWDVGTDFTLRFWYKASAAYDPSSAFTLENKNESFSVYRYGGSGQIQFVLECLTTGLDSVETLPSAVGVWHRVVCWFENGVGMGIKLDNDADVTFATVNPLQTLGVDHRLYLDMSHFDANEAIDEIALWNRKLTAAEILTDWNSGNGKTYPDVPL